MPYRLLISSQSSGAMSLLIWICLVNDKQCRSRSAGFRRSHLIWIYTVFKIGYEGLKMLRTRGVKGSGLFQDSRFAIESQPQNAELEEL